MAESGLPLLTHGECRPCAPLTTLAAIGGEMLRHVEARQRFTTSMGLTFRNTNPRWRASNPIRWVAPANRHTFEVVEALARRVARPSVPGHPKKRYRLIQTQFVFRRECRAANFHEDYAEEVGWNGATLLTPLWPLVGDRLWYRLEGRRRTYRYRVGRWVMFGGGLMHTTAPYKRRGLLWDCLLCQVYFCPPKRLFPSLASYVAAQSQFYRTPDGEFVGRELR